MNAFQTRAIRRPFSATIMAGAMALSLIACSGGGGGTTTRLIVDSISPAESLDLNGGETVVITGQNFLEARIARVIFGDGNPGFGLTVVSDTRIEVTVPPSPSGNAGTVNVDVESLDLGTRGINGGFTYVGDSGPTGPPVPQTIVPTNFTATGAEKFTIGGTNLGPGGGQVNVNFVGIGLVQATVSQDGTLATGNAPVSPSVPVGTAIQVIVDNQGQGAEVPTRVNFNYAGVISWLIPFQEASGNSSRPVRVQNGMAVIATAGTDGNWGNPVGTGNDSLWMITGAPLPSAATDLFAAQPAAVRRLNKNNSVPVAMDDDTVCVYSPGLDGVILTADDVVLVVTNLQSPTPLVRQVPVPMLTPAPLARISSTKLAFTTRGTGTGGQDELRFIDLSGAVPSLMSTRVDIGLTDFSNIAGRAHRSIPFSPDGDAVFVLALGPPGGARIFGDANDFVTRYVLSTGETNKFQTWWLLDSPVALSATRVVAPVSFRANAPDPRADDNLAVFDYSGGLFGRTLYGVGARIQTGGLHIMATLGGGHVVFSHGGANSLPGDADDQLAVFRDDGAGGFTKLDLNLAGRPLFAPLGDGSLVVFGRGNDLAPGSDPDRVLHIKADGASFAEFAGAPLWPQGTLAATDGTRVFAIGAGADHPFYGSGNEELLVFQTKSLGSPIAAATLPMSPPVGYRVFAAPSQLGQVRTPFVPVGNSWGLMQSPGLSNFFSLGTDRILVVGY